MEKTYEQKMTELDVQLLQLERQYAKIGTERAQAELTKQDKSKLSPRALEMLANQDLRRSAEMINLDLAKREIRNQKENLKKDLGFFEVEVIPNQGRRSQMSEIQKVEYIKRFGMASYKNLDF